MPRWMVVFDDTAAMAAIRATRADAHAAYLAANRDRIDPDATPVEARDIAAGRDMWLVHAQCDSDVEDLVINDPWFAPLSRHFTIHALEDVSPQPAAFTA